jgi:hypothetical protein
MTELPDATITSDQVYIADIPLPGFIEDDSVIVRPGGHKNLNRIQATFLVGKVDITETPPR